MAKKSNYGKIAAVVFLTVLIWVWADLSLDKDFPAPAVVVSVAESANPKLWVCFNDETSGPVRKIVLKEVLLKGPVSRITKLERRLKEGEKLEISFDAVREKMETPNNYKLDLLPFLQKDKGIRQLDLKVVSCTPTEVPVTVVGLVEKSLEVVCFDEDRNPVKTTTIEPPQVKMFVTADWFSPAEVKLTQSEIDQARSLPLEKTPYIVSPTGQIRESPKTVKIKASPQDDQLTDHLITTATLGIALSPTMQEKYKVQITNPAVVMSAIAIKATADAKRAYQMQPLPSMTLYILDGDEKVEGEPKREVVYNFPEEFVRKREIELKGQPVEARFKLIPLASPQ